MKLTSLTIVAFLTQVVLFSMTPDATAAEAGRSVLDKGVKLSCTDIKVVEKEGRKYTEAKPKSGCEFLFPKNEPNVIISVKKGSYEISNGQLSLFGSPFDRFQCPSCGTCKRERGLHGSVHCKGECSGFSACAVFDAGPKKLEGLTF